jgi:thiosulfate dehydrogenase [quinone] large subunit
MTTEATSTDRSNAAALAALLLVQLALGYEWLVSGLTKIVHGDFPRGLAGELADLHAQAPGWYRGFLTGAVEPYGRAFGYAIEVSELLAGVVLVGAALGLLFGASRLSSRVQRRLQLATGAAALVGLALLVNFELASGGKFGLALASDSFDEGVSLDTLMIGLHLALLVFAAAALPRRSRRERLRTLEVSR